MNLFGLATFSFGAPWFLAFVPPIIGFLVYAYLRKGRESPLLVGTTFILKNFIGTPSKRSRPKLPLRFLFELLILLLLVLALSKAMYQREGKQIAVLLDNSLSMAALDYSKPLPVSRIDDARDRFAQISDTFRSSDRIRVFQTSPTLQEVTTQDVDVATASELMKTLEVAFFNDSLESAVETLRGSSRFDDIVILTDRPVEILDSQGAPKALPANVTAEVVGGDLNDDSRNNLMVSGITATLLEKGATSQRIEVAVQSFARTSLTIALHLEGISTVNRFTPPAVWKELGREELEVRAGASERVSFPEIALGFGIFRARIEIVRSKDSQKGVDILSSDDVMWFVPESGSKEIVLISEKTPRELNLESLRGFSIRHIPISQYEAMAQNPPVGLSAIFYRVSPATLPRFNSLFVLPPVGKGAVDSEAVLQNGEITRWQTEHPTLSYLNLSGVTIDSGMRLQIPPWGKEIVASTAGPLVVAGEDRGNRYEILGFDLFPYGGSEKPLESILLLNNLKWLSDTSVQLGYRNVFEDLSEDRQAINFTYLDGPKILGEQFLTAAPAPGLIWIPNEQSGGSLEAINFSDPSESDLSLRKPAFIKDLEIGNETKSDESQVSLTAWFIMFLFALLILDIANSLAQSIRLQVQRSRVS